MYLIKFICLYEFFFVKVYVLLIYVIKIIFLVLFWYILNSLYYICF